MKGDERSGTTPWVHLTRPGTTCPRPFRGERRAWPGHFGLRASVCAWVCLGQMQQSPGFQGAHMQPHGLARCAHVCAHFRVPHFSCEAAQRVVHACGAETVQGQRVGPGQQGPLDSPHTHSRVGQGVRATPAHSRPGSTPSGSPPPSQGSTCPYTLSGSAPALPPQRWPPSGPPQTSASHQNPGHRNAAPASSQSPRAGSPG